MRHPLARLHDFGQSPWYDFITRDLVQGGGLERLIRDDGLRGMTSNPTIFEKAIATSDAYDADIAALTAAGHDAVAVFEALAVADVQAACDRFAALFATARDGDGTVSLEVAPTLAHDTDGTVAEAERLWACVGRPNLMVKIPGTRAGLPAITAALAAGISVNVTLLFGVERYEAVLDAWLTGLERRAARGAPLAGVHSVASFFVSRVDTAVDRQLPAGSPLRGRAAIANATAAYTAFERMLGGARWQALAVRGAAVQRPLWASTSTKDPAYPATYYVEALVAERTVNTLPPETFDAYRDHGAPAAGRLDPDGAARTLRALADAGIDLAAVTAELERDGVDRFAASHRSLLAGLAAKAGALAAS